MRDGHARGHQGGRARVRAPGLWLIRSLRHVGATPGCLIGAGGEPVHEGGREPARVDAAVGWRLMAVAAPPGSLTEPSALALAAAIRAGETSASEVVDAHIEVLRRAQARSRPLALERFAEAREEAAAADEEIAGAASAEELPPLVGIPCTIKESIAVRGMPNCSGLASRRDYRCTETAPSAQRLLDAGAILLGVTNTSELTLWIESSNRVYGRTSNIYDPTRTAGGSSGGEGVAVASGGSPIGLGTDFGGSIRLPASSVVLGDPDTISVDGLEVVLFEATSRIPARRELRDARDRAAGELEAAGARVRREPMKDMRRALELYLAAAAAWSETGARDILDQAGAEFSWRRALSRKSPHTAALLLLLAVERPAGRMVRRTRRALAAAVALAREVAARIGDGVLLHPPFPRVAPRHGATVGRPWVIANAAVFNLIGLPVTQVPLGLGQRGLPLGVQVVAGRGRDHQTIAVALELERRLGGWVPPSW
ncbi:MAG: amidase [Actinobacteria bacterium]|nr:MAG: amidase [Actinomycetota bacterium]